MFNERILDLLGELEEAISDWERYQSIPLDEILYNRDKRNMVLHALLIAIQATIDIANHLIVKYKLKRPSTYRETFEILGERGILSRELSKKLAELAGFRNVLVHIYWRLDIHEVYDVPMKDLEVIKEFRDVVRKLLKDL